MRITIIGNCGSGKSTLARKISQKFNIPHVDLDRFWFEAQGHLLKGPENKERVQAHVRGKIEEFILQDSWVSDGWSRRAHDKIAARADYIVFLDIPLWRRLMNHLYRVFFTPRHQELSKWDDVKFTYQVVRRTFTQGVQMRQFMRTQPREKAVHLRSYAAAEQFLERLATKQ
jgi:adenylate kinase family enzyme